VDFVKAMKRSVEVTLGRFANDALVNVQLNGGTRVETSVVRAIRFYLADKGSGQLGWIYPPFLQRRKPAEGIELQLSIEDSLWNAFLDEAEEQGVTVRQMLEHAVFYFAAEINAGRLTERILEDFDLDD